MDGLSRESWEACGGSHEPTEAFLFVDRQASRQFWYHVLQLPGEPAVRWHQRIGHALTAVELAVHHRVVVCSSGRHWTLNLETAET